MLENPGRKSCAVIGDDTDATCTRLARDRLYPELQALTYEVLLPTR
jgi:hypothetical protein